MPKIEITEETHEKLLTLKNHWSLTYRKITNKVVLEKIDSLKEEIFGYGPATKPEEIQRISASKSRSQLESESGRFQIEFNKILKSGLDFEPEYTMNEHLQKMAELIDDSAEIGTPLF
jgi:hypothetical protein